MPRDHARIHLNIWGDDGWRKLSPPAQHLYLTLWSSPTLSFCGVDDWRPGKIASRARGWDAPAVEYAAAELSAELFIVVDAASEEVLIRSWIKHDGLFRIPNMAVSMANARSSVESPSIRGVIVHEVSKLRDEEPELSGWRRDAVASMLKQTPINPSAIPTFNPSVNPPSNPWVNPSANPLANPPSTPSPSPKERPGSATPPREDVETLCTRLRDLIVEGGSKAEISDGWRTDARLLLDKDGREFDKALKLIEWSQRDSFWRTNILSMPAFRKQYDKLRLQANSEAGFSGSSIDPNTGAHHEGW